MTQHLGNASLPKEPQTYWRDSVSIPSFRPLEEDAKVDVAIVGGGITGITAAYLLASEGVKVALLEADRLLNGTTGHTTAKITAQHNLFYDELLNHVGLEKARQYYQSNTEAIEFIEKTAKELQVDCDFQRENAWVYAVTQKYARRVEKERRAYETIGIYGEMVDEIPLNLEVQNALIMKNQAQFHPLKFLVALVRELQKRGAQIYEGTTAVDVQDENQPYVVTRNGKRVSADKILACSHFPFYEGTGFYFTRMYASRSYLLAAKVEKDYPGGMYISAERPERSLRSVSINNEPMVLIGGESHKTGQGMDTMDHYAALSSFGQDVLGLKEVRYRWSAQDLVTLDKIPYIGQVTGGHPNVYVATGYKKWGMTSGTVAALLLRDLVLQRPNAYKDLYDPSRFHVDPSLKTFLATNGDVAAHLIKGKLESPQRGIEDLPRNEGRVVTYQGQRAGAYRDEEGRLFVVDTTCTHLGCEVAWNRGDKTWDCPCHGSRFTYRGDVMEGPAEKPLKRLK